MKIISKHVALLIATTLCLCASVYANAQMKEDKKVIANNVFSQLKNINAMAYNYIVTAYFPNGQDDKLYGEVYNDREKKIKYNNNQLEISLITANWYYRVNHYDKTVEVIDVDRHFKENDRKKLNKITFNKDGFSYFIDSGLLKHAIIQKAIVKNDTATVQMTFPAQYSIKDIVFIYNQKNHLPVSFLMHVFYPGTQYDKSHGTSETIYCYNYRNSIPVNKYSPNSYFTYRNNKIILKKYKKYKLNAQL